MCGQDYWNTEGLIQPDIHTMSNYFNELQIHLGIYSLGTEIQEKMGNRKEKNKSTARKSSSYKYAWCFYP